MPLPKSVARQAAEADRMVRVINGSNDPADGAPVVEPTSLPPAVQQPAPVQTPPASAPANQPPAHPPAAPTASAPPAQPPAAPPPSNEWEQRYHVLQGKYNAELPALQGQLGNAMTTISNMGRELDTLREQLATVRAQPAASPASRMMTPQDEQTWGADMIDMVGRKAVEEAQRLMQPLVDENSRLKQMVTDLRGQTQRVEQSQMQTVEQVFWQRMGELVPDWEAINNDQGFFAWLAQFDPLMGAVRHDELKKARAALDWKRTTAFFKAYKDTLPPPAAVPPQDELILQVSPQKVRAATQVPVNGGTGTVEIWSSEEIQQFYTDVSKGRYKNDPQEQARMNTAITQAVAEGRVR